ncbi:unnamed protein product [Polarella glacialis]|uniref:VOC domain-containing protein n=1 Tax=Polarella glacialis TaxID=89957 RepID=A0A813KVM7_POLGL|nr:unnamed protein product [Polarella glacialis]
MTGTTLELTHNHGSEEDPNFKVWSGNHGCDLPKDSPLYKEGAVRGFGHIAFNMPDIVASSEALEKQGVKFQKRPHEGRMKTIAFALDPDGYWIELVPRGDALPETENLSQTMLRVKDADASIAFYRDILGMTLVRAMHVPGDFSNYFLASLTPEQREKDPVGFGHIGYLVDDLVACCKEMEDLVGVLRAFASESQLLPCLGG